MFKLSKSLLLFCLYAIGMIVVPLIIFTVAIFFTPIDPKIIQDPALLYAIELQYTSFSTFGGYIFLTLTFFFILRKNICQQLKQIKSIGHFIAVSLLGLVATIAASIIGSSLLNLIGVTEEAANQVSVEASVVTLPFIMMIMVVFLAPFVEEVIFRFVLIKTFKLPQWGSILLSSLAFGFIHVIGDAPLQIIPYAFMGAVLAFVYVKTDNIWYAIAVHSLRNAFSLVIILLL